MAITEEQITEALKNVIDPDFQKDLVSLNMIKDVEVKGNKVSFTIELTTPACPLKDVLYNDSVAAIKKHVGDELEIEIDFSSKVTTKREDLDLLPNVKNIIAVASGKGGVGKSTMSVNLAIGLAKNGAKVGLLDADIYGPSIPLMLGLKGARPGVEEVEGKSMLLPLEKHGIKILSIGFLVDEKQPIVWRGPMVTSALRQFITDCIWGELDYLIIDLPPGTGDIHLTLVQTLPLTGALIVTTPQDVAMADAKKALTMFKMGKIDIPVLGVIENMSWFTPAELPENKYYIFGRDGGKELAKEFNVPLLGEIPIVQSIREGGDFGVPAILNENNIVQKSFESLVKNTAQQISIRNATLAPTKVVEITTT
jgi:ATP-binding protein involved in chromosome partitioning